MANMLNVVGQLHSYYIERTVLVQRSQSNFQTNCSTYYIVYKLTKLTTKRQKSLASRCIHFCVQRTLAHALTR